MTESRLRGMALEEAVMPSSVTLPDVVEKQSLAQNRSE